MRFVQALVVWRAMRVSHVAQRARLHYGAIDAEVELCQSRLLRANLGRALLQHDFLSWRWAIGERW